MSWILIIHHNHNNKNNDKSKHKVQIETQLDIRVKTKGNNLKILTLTTNNLIKVLDHHRFQINNLKTIIPNCIMVFTRLKAMILGHVVTTINSCKFFQKNKDNSL